MELKFLDKLRRVLPITGPLPPKSTGDLEAELAAARADKMALAEQLSRVSRERDIAVRDEAKAERIVESMIDKLDRMQFALRTIGATASRNGTAQRLARLAREARE